jgi:hypothetical protein
MYLQLYSLLPSRVQRSCARLTQKHCVELHSIADKLALLTEQLFSEHGSCYTVTFYSKNTECSANLQAITLPILVAREFILSFCPGSTFLNISALSVTLTPARCVLFNGKNRIHTMRVSIRTQSRCNTRSRTGRRYALACVCAI